MLADMTDFIDTAIMGERCTTSSTEHPPPLTFDKLKRLHEFLKPEVLTVNGEAHEIYGFNIHRSEFAPPGLIILTEKDNPNSVMPRLGRMVIIDEEKGKALVCDPSKGLGDE